MTEKNRIMSGMRPTGKLHLGHLMGVLINWAELQKKYECFFEIADLHALTTKYDKTENLRNDVVDVVLDWLATGIDPTQSTIFVQSLVPEISELHVYLSMVTPESWVEKDPTLKDMVKILKNKENSGSNFNSQLSYGLLGYPVLMSADIMIFNANLVPVGVDQVAHIEITRDIARRFNNLYKTEFFVEPKPLLNKTPLLKGVNGEKMGKSFNNDIKISDTEEVTTKKIMQAITDRSRLRKDDLGHPDKCEAVFDYYKTFAPEKVKELEQTCKKGQIGCMDCKKELAKIINEYLAPIREKRLQYEKDPKFVREIILEGSLKARKEAKIILNGVKEVMNIYS